MSSDETQTCGDFGGRTLKGAACSNEAGKGTDHPGEGRCHYHPPETAADPNKVESPRDWDTAVSYAYLRLIDHTQEEAAVGAGIGQRTARRWENSDWWHDAVDEASGRWLKNLEEESRRTLVRGIKNDDRGKLALDVLERRDERLAPAKQRHEILRDYLHFDEVEKLLSTFGARVGEIVSDPGEKKAILEAAEEMMRRATDRAA